MLADVYFVNILFAIAAHQALIRPININRIETVHESNDGGVMFIKHMSKCVSLLEVVASLILVTLQMFMVCNVFGREFILLFLNWSYLDLWME